MREFDHHNKTYRSDIDQAVAFSGQSHDFFVRVKADCLVEILRPLLGHVPAAAPLKILDVGCGHGHIHRYLNRPDLPISLHAIDIAATVVKEARRTNPAVAYQVYEGEKLPYPDGSFDAAFTITVMHHVPPAQWPAFLAEMKRVVRPGGLVVVFEHNPLNPLTQWIVSTCPLDGNAVLFSRATLVRIAGQVGLTDIQGRYILFLPFDGKAFRGFDRLFGWLPLGAQYHVSARVPG